MYLLEQVERLRLCSLFCSIFVQTPEINCGGQLYLFVTFYQDYMESVSQMAFLSFALHACLGEVVRD